MTEYNNMELGRFLAVMDKYEDTHIVIHEAAKRIRQLNASYTRDSDTVVCIDGRLYSMMDDKEAVNHIRGTGETARGVEPEGRNE